jgi:hypothetical protein
MAQPGERTSQQSLAVPRGVEMSKMTSSPIYRDFPRGQVAAGVFFLNHGIFLHRREAK